ncbi:MAG: hypothetical protein ACM3ML_24995 [Micromonosporaceae bacterium]
MRLGREKATGYAEDDAAIAADAADAGLAGSVTASGPGSVPAPEDGLERVATG